MRVRWGNVLLLCLVLLLIVGLYAFVSSALEARETDKYLSWSDKADMYKLNVYARAMAIMKPDIQMDCSADAPASELYVEFKPKLVRNIEKVDLNCVDRYQYIITKKDVSTSGAILERTLIDNGCDVTNYDTRDDAVYIWKCPERNCAMKEVDTYEWLPNQYDQDVVQQIAPKYLKLFSLENLNCKIHISAGK